MRAGQLSASPGAGSEPLPHAPCRAHAAQPQVCCSGQVRVVVRASALPGREGVPVGPLVPAWQPSALTRRAHHHAWAPLRMGFAV